MDELSPLFQDIEFRERLRGYDVEEVDAYIDRIAKAAALVQGRIAELQQRAEAAESRLSERPTALESEDSMSRVLLLAQRTADAAVAEAQAEASDVLARAHAEAAATRAEADEYASRVLAEADTDRRQAIVDAEAAAAEAIGHERDRVADAIAELEQYRAFLAEDIDILERHLVDSRDSLATSLAGLADLLESPESFRAPSMPATSGAVAPAALLESVEPTVLEEPLESAVDDQPSSGDVSSEEPTTEMDSPTATGVDVDVDVDVDVVHEPWLDEARATIHPHESPVDNELASPEASDPTSPSSVPALADEDAEWGSAPAALFETSDDEDAPLATSQTVAGTGPAEDRPSDPTDGLDEIDLTQAPIDLVSAEQPRVEPPLLVTAADLEASESGDEWVRDLHVDAGPITEPVPMVTDQLLFQPPGPTSSVAADPFLDQLREAVARDDADDAADDALAAFFDGDADDGARSWFPRRR